MADLDWGTDEDGNPLAASPDYRLPNWTRPYSPGPRVSSTREVRRREAAVRRREKQGAARAAARRSKPGRI